MTLSHRTGSTYPSAASHSSSRRVSTAARSGLCFEPNDPLLWAQIRVSVTAFMDNLLRSGAFQGLTPAEAYFVKCDEETTTQADIDAEIVNVVVGFAPLKPAEFVIIRIQQLADCCSA